MEEPDGIIANDVVAALPVPVLPRPMYLPTLVIQLQRPYERPMLTFIMNCEDGMTVIKQLCFSRIRVLGAVASWEVRVIRLNQGDNFARIRIVMNRR